jgi:hypothetical protein
MAGGPPRGEEHRNERESEHRVDDQRSADFGLPHLDEIEYAAYQM